MKKVKLYNVLFPIWLLWLFPVTWLIVLPGNFLIDFAAVNYNPFKNIWGFLWVTLCVVLTAILIYFFNYKWCLKKADFDEKQRKKVALSLAIFTAPYLFYLPSILLYQ